MDVTRTEYYMLIVDPDELNVIWEALAVLTQENTPDDTLAVELLRAIDEASPNR